MSKHNEVLKAYIQSGDIKFRHAGLKSIGFIRHHGGIVYAMSVCHEKDAHFYNRGKARLMIAGRILSKISDEKFPRAGFISIDCSDMNAKEILDYIESIE